MTENSDVQVRSLAGKVALVTGSAKRLGRAVAMRLAAEGADLVIHHGASHAEAAETVAEIEKLGRRAVAFPPILKLWMKFARCSWALRRRLGIWIFW